MNSYDIWNMEKKRSNMGKKIEHVIITGASGPLGSMLVRECLSHHVSVLAVIRPNSKNRENLPKHPLLSIKECDIMEIDQLEVKPHYDVCFHLAWSHTGDGGRDNPMLQYQNIEATLKTAEWAKKMGCSIFIGSGSQAEYGLINRKVDETTPERPVTMYGVCKLAAGKLTMEYCKQQGMRCNWVRIFGVYGPYENDYIFTSYLIRTLLAGKEPLLTPSEQIWDYLYCEDAVHALWLIAEKARESGVYCLGSGDVKTVQEYACIIRDQINPSQKIGFGKKPYAPNQIMHLEADITKLKTDVAFKPHYSFQEGIQKTIDWYEKKCR